MLKAIKKLSGPSYVLHSEASLFKLYPPNKSQTKDFWTAYRYHRSRTRFLRYHEFAARHIPLGTGVTEAACTTVITQRPKLSEMRWTREGAGTILNLRTILLSRTWPATFDRHSQSLARPYPDLTNQPSNQPPNSPPNSSPCSDHTRTKPEGRLKNL